MLFVAVALSKLIYLDPILSANLMGWHSNFFTQEQFYSGTQKAALVGSITVADFLWLYFKYIQTQAKTMVFICAIMAGCLCLLYCTSCMHFPCMHMHTVFSHGMACSFQHTEEGLSLKCPVYDNYLTLSRPFLSLHILKSHPLRRNAQEMGKVLPWHPSKQCRHNESN